jgi:hypothetical protein
MQDRSALIAGAQFEERKASFLETWINRSEFKKRYPPELSNRQFVQALLNTASEATAKRLTSLVESFVSELGANGSRGKLLATLIEQERRSLSEDPKATVLLQYFVYLRRDPDADGYAFWVGNLKTHGPSVYRSIIRSFLVSEEYRARFKND